MDGYQFFLFSFFSLFFLSLQILFFISKPDVFKSPNSETYVIFGEAKIEDLSSQLQTQAAQQFRMPDMGSVMAKPDASSAAAGAQQDEEEEEVDETAVEPRDIDLVMTQAGVSRSKAVKALKTHNGDIVSAIMELTTWVDLLPCSIFLSMNLVIVVGEMTELLLYFCALNTISVADTISFAVRMRILLASCFNG